MVGWLWRGFHFGGFIGGLAPAFLGLRSQACAHRALHVLVGGGCGVGKLNSLCFKIVVVPTLIAILFRGLSRFALGRLAVGSAVGWCAWVHFSAWAGIVATARWRLRRWFWRGRLLMAVVIALGSLVGSVLRSPVAVAARVCWVATHRVDSGGLSEASLVCSGLGSRAGSGSGGRHGRVGWFYVGY